MRLLSSRTLHFHEFFDADIPPYAIVSHRWGKDEVSYQDFLLLTRSASGTLYYSQPLTQALQLKRNGVGMQKIEASCRLARRNDVDWIWIDTCCIDKTSSSELSEAINSMYRWYERSAVCFAYLEDVDCPGPLLDESKNHKKLKQFLESLWWTRGWTLQELLAPKSVSFLDVRWNAFGTKATLAEIISDHTGIDEIYLENAERLRNCIAAKKMSWAAKRVTSRVEDGAYCLMGLFDVTMPLVYGEGERAFVRLQEEIIRRSDDLTIFTHMGGDFLAKSAADFRTIDYNDVYRGVPASWKMGEDFCFDHYGVTNKGIELTGPYIDVDATYGTSENQRILERSGLRYRCILLDCHLSSQNDAVMIPIRQHALLTGKNRWTKCMPGTQQYDTAIDISRQILYLLHEENKRPFRLGTFYVN